VLVVGDLNALSFFPGMRSLRRAGLVDAWATATWRPGLTWSPWTWLPPIARIDYILVPPVLAVTAGRVAEVPGSDHRMVVADLAWPTEI
jgi:endonuclease/exonuclease/phosphatase family metal-dependent hydrolase